MLQGGVCGGSADLQCEVGGVLACSVRWGGNAGLQCKVGGNAGLQCKVGGSAGLQCEVCVCVCCFQCKVGVVLACSVVWG